MSRSTQLSDDERRYYARTLALPEIGLEGQRRLKAASVLLVGLGGLGSPMSLYLAINGVGRLGLLDDDVVEPSNLSRQAVHQRTGLGIPKVHSAKERLLRANPDVEIDAHPVRLTADNAQRYVEAYDLVADGSDNFATRFLVNDACVRAGKTNVHASLHRYEGQVSVFDPTRGPCYRCLYAEPPPDLHAESDDHGVFGMLAGVVGMLQATEVVKAILGIGRPLIGRLLTYDALAMSFRDLKVSRDPACPTCGEASER